ncbi:MAG TPA: hypothetical protein VMM15_12095 [Bradyrhizobium sp.]|nr:hypothetical protein [Bradyrhizobium sp.]
MNIEHRALSASLSRRFVLSFAVLVAAFREARAAMTIAVTAQSGVPFRCTRSDWRVDAQGKEWPVTLQYTARPAHGSVHTEVSLQPKALRNGTIKTVHVADWVYQSKKGYVGEDSFTYRHVTADPTDTRNGNEYTVAVTVR